MNATRRLRALGWIAFCLLAASGRAEAACTISTTPVSFGNYDVFSATNVDVNGTVTYRCNAFTLRVTITLNTGGSGSFNPRAMRKGTEPLTYNLYTTAARTTVWGDGTGGTGTYQRWLPPQNTDIVVTVYGRLFAGQDVTAGLYTDTVVATINF